MSTTKNWKEQNEYQMVTFELNGGRFSKHPEKILSTASSSRGAMVTGKNLFTGHKDYDKNFCAYQPNTTDWIVGIDKTNPVKQCQLYTQLGQITWSSVLSNS